MKKTCIWGATIYCVTTLLTQLACSSLHGGESLIGLLLLVPWVAVFALPNMFCHFLGWQWRLGEYGNITSEMVLTALAFNAVLGALLGAALWKGWQLAKRLFRRDEHT
ncbi:MAG: hypothetical protein HY298_01070 [Verrucomicrobia bacterium]|nr:hypothetical protein [Verrucomicrobiota bacterium]